MKWIEIPEQELEDVIDYIDDDDTWWFDYGIRNRRNTDQRTTSVGLWNTAIGRHGNIKNIRESTIAHLYMNIDVFFCIHSSSRGNIYAYWCRFDSYLNFSSISSRVHLSTG